MSPTEPGSRDPRGRGPDRPSGPARDTPFVDQLAEFDDALADGAEPPDPADDDPRQARNRRLLRAVEELLPRHAARATTGAGACGQVIPARFGRFRVLRELGRGGYGVVFLAHDPVLRRMVALKVPRAEVLAGSDARRRFLREGRAAAALDHPGIVRVYEAGVVGPIAFIASAYVEGGNLAEWLHARAEPVPFTSAAELMADLAEAVQHAHDHRVIHRDLKPGNILLRVEGNELAGAELRLTGKIVDFGLAKIVDEEATDTISGQPIGSIPYMSPEQALGKPSEIGCEADIYSLGVIFYQLLTGRVPFRGETPLETIRQVVEDDALEPCRLRPGLPRDLQTIVQNCLEKAPGSRYASAGELAADLRRFRKNQPIVAQPPAPWRAAWRWLKRRPEVGVLAAAALLASAGIWAGLAWSNAELRESVRREQVSTAEANRQRKAAEDHAWLNRRALHASRLSTAARERDAGRIPEAQALLAQEAPAPGEPDLRGFAWRLLHGLTYAEAEFLPARLGTVHALAVSGDGRRLVTAWDDQITSASAVIWDLEHPGRPPLWRIRGRVKPSLICKLAFSPDLFTIAVAEAENAGASSRISLWDARGSAAPLGALDLAYGNIVAMAFDPSGKFLAISGRTKPERREFALFEIKARGLMPVKVDLSSSEWILCLPGRGLTALVLDEVGGRLIDAKTGVAWLELADGVVRPCRSAAASPDGRSLAIGQNAGLVSLLDLTTGEVRRSAHLPQGDALCLAYSPDSRSLAVGSSLQNAYLLDASTGAIRRTAHHDIRSLVREVTFTPDGRSWISGGDDDRVAIRRTDPQCNPVELAGHVIEAWSLSWSPDGKTLSSGGDDDLIRIWDRATGAEVARSEPNGTMISAVAFAPGGRQIAAADYSGKVRLRDVASLGRSKPMTLEHPNRPRALAYRPDGGLLVSGGMDGFVRAWDPANGRALASQHADDRGVRDVKFDPAGAVLASAGMDRSIKLWDARTLEPISSFLAGDDEIWSMSFSPDGKTLASAGKDGHLRVHNRDGSDGREIGLCGVGVEAVLFLPDGETVATAGHDGKVRLWDVLARQELLALDDHGARVNALAVAPDAQAFASADHSGRIKIWKLDEPPAAP